MTVAPGGLDALEMTLSIWKDGELRSPENATVSVWDHGLLYGDGVFEGIRLRRDLIYRLPDHLGRLRRSCRILGLTLAHSDDDLRRAIASVCRANNLHDAHVRIVVTRGPGRPGLDPSRSPVPTTIVMASQLPPPLGSAPLRLITSSVVRKAPRSVDAAVKSLNYLDSVLAKLQANEAGADDAIMLDASSLVAEATGTNVFVVRNGRLVTPACTAALPGITRATVLELAARDGIEAVEAPLSVGDLYTADEAFVTGTASGIVPIGSLDGRPIPAPGPITERICRAYEATWFAPGYAEQLA